ncbi:unnamed protein product [Darwinula stevensoni]|uniref:EGF-like domain-containing protein n=1 Tax=Darwinula stevensoni TaxID=69355 RepID=A0A7R9A2D2_9CRUS|nr:unnamed protein product [Darwinula stevensoni]CAG0889466.1 unnamed protein product [Darwinula stevensoni]
MAGARCESRCGGGTNGEECNEYCPCGEELECDAREHECLCPPGWTGTDCRQSCPDGFFGRGCREPCPECGNGEGILVIGLVLWKKGARIIALGFLDFFEMLPVRLDWMHWDENC